MNDHILSVAQRCLVSIQMGDYKDEIYCNVLPMDVAHVLLGRPWLYDLNVTIFGKDNIYSFKYKDKYKNIILRPAKLKGCNGKRDISKLHERNLHILKCKKFEREGIGIGMCLALVAKEVSFYSIIRKLRSNAYLLDLSNDMDTNPIFNIEDLLPYRGNFESSTLSSSVSSSEASKGALTMPSLQYSKETVDIILDDESVTSGDGGFRRFLVK